MVLDVDELHFRLIFSKLFSTHMRMKYLRGDEKHMLDFSGFLQHVILQIETVEFIAGP